MKIKPWRLMSGWNTQQNANSYVGLYNNSNLGEYLALLQNQFVFPSGLVGGLTVQIAPPAGAVPGVPVLAGSPRLAGQLFGGNSNLGNGNQFNFLANSGFWGLTGDGTLPIVILPQGWALEYQSNDLAGGDTVGWVWQVLHLRDLYDQPCDICDAPWHS